MSELDRAADRGSNSKISDFNIIEALKEIRQRLRSLENKVDSLSRGFEPRP